MIITMEKNIFDQDANDYDDINDYPITHHWIKVVVYHSGTVFSNWWGHVKTITMLYTHD